MSARGAAKISAPSEPFALARRLKAPVWVYDTDNGCIAYANEAACEIWEAPSEAELCSRNLRKDMSSTVEERLLQYQRDFISRDASFSEYWTLYPRGVPTTIKVVMSGFVMPDGRMAMLSEVIGVVDDEPENLRSTEALLHTDVMITLYSVDGESLYANPAARNATPDDADSFEALFCDSREYEEMRAEWDQQRLCRRVVQVRSARGDRWFDMSVKPCLDAATGKHALLVTSVDVSELKIARDKARYLADRDQLTGCFNRSFITQRLELISGERARGSRDCAVLFLDIDNFKSVNDRFGHEVGDLLLQTFARRVQSQIRQSDTLARIGGDEFILLIEDVSDPDVLNERLAAIQAEVGKPVECGAIRLNITTSIGVSMINSDSAHEWSEIIKQADIALYSSKRSGRNRHTVFNEALGAEVSERNWLECELKTAIESASFSLHFQPRIDIATCQVVAAEALLRWNHPERGFIPPTTFIPICERTGMIDDLGVLVLEKTKEQLDAWRRTGIDIDLSLNVSPVQFQHPDLVERYRAIVERGRLPVNGLELEITESSLFRDDAAFSEKIEQITGLGFRIALDDFGTGYSNLAHVSRFPLSCIKLDMSYVQSLPESEPLLLLILTLARQIGAVTVAEGVETTEQLRWLLARGCDQIQGHLFSPAVPAEQFPGVVRAVEDKARRVMEASLTLSKALNA